MTVMHSHVLPIWRTIAATYREWWRMLPVLRPLVVNAVLIVIAISALDALVPARWSMQDPSASIITLIEAALRALLLAPVVAAIHRFIIRDNIAKAYALPLGDASFQRFFAWLLALELIGGFPLDFLGWMQAFNVSAGASTVAFAAALVAAFVLMLRLAILPPAIAVGAPGARVAQALADTRGYGLRIFAIFVLALVPWFALGGLIGMILIRPGSEASGSVTAMTGIVAGGIIQTITLTLMAVIASLLFIALAAQVRNPGGSK
jgi:hypothetical protein